MQKIKTQDAVGQVVCHDITQTIKAVKTGVLFKKGHIVQEADIEKLLAVGKDHLYIYEANAQMLHENEAAKLLYQACAGEWASMKPTPVQEGKIEVIATRAGLLKVDTKRLQLVNEIGNLIIATRHNNTVVKAGDTLAGMRIIPLVIAKEIMTKLASISNQEPLLQIKEFQRFTVGVIITGNEVYHGRIADTFTEVIALKLQNYHLKIDYHRVVPDEVDAIKSAIEAFCEQGVQLIICTGGMSVDPDDVTPLAIKKAGAKILTYGAPVLPGSMLLIGYLKNDIPILGLPGCVMYAKTTSFDLIFPRILAKDPLTNAEIAAFGHGGLCRKCHNCTFPHCEFGKGSVS